MVVCGHACSLIFDKCSCMNLVGEHFVRNKLQIKSEDILPSLVRIKEISCQVFLAVRKVKLNFFSVREV